MNTDIPIIPTRTSRAFNTDLPVGSLYIYAATRVRNLNPGLGAVQEGIHVGIYRRGEWYDECLQRFDVVAHDVYEPQTRNQIGRLGAYRPVVTPEERDAAIRTAMEWAAREMGEL